MIHLLMILGLAIIGALGLYTMIKQRAFPLAMTALQADGDYPSRGMILGLGEYPVAATTVIYEGALVCLNSSGYAVPGSTATGLIALGRCREQADNSDGGAGDINVKVEFGIFRWANSTMTDLIDLTCVGSSAYIVYDNQVAKTSGSSTRSLAGPIMDVDSDSVWIFCAPFMYTKIGIVAANNLSDVSAAATARANLGANKIVVSLRATDLVGSDAVLYGLVSPVAGTITNIRAVLKGHALTTGNATLTGKIGGTPITTGAVTIIQSGSAIGDKYTLTPSGANVLAAGDEIQFLVGGTNDNSAAFAEISLLIAT